MEVYVKIATSHGQKFQILENNLPYPSLGQIEPWLQNQDFGEFDSCTITIGYPKVVCISSDDWVEFIWDANNEIETYETFDSLPD